MTGVFTEILKMSLAGGIAALVVVLARIPLKKAPKVYSYLLWSVVFFRLLCPLYIEVKGVPQYSNFIDNPIPAQFNFGNFLSSQSKTDVGIQSSQEIQDNRAGNSLQSSQEQTLTTGSVKSFSLLSVLTGIWLTGTALMLIYGVLSSLVLKRKTANSQWIEKNIYSCAGIPSPFVMGLFAPKIYLPYMPAEINDGEHAYICLHEQTHIRRLDHIVRVAAFITVCIHWFNPLAWIAFTLMCRDMEMSCDEAVIGKMMNTMGGIKKQYSQSLLSLASIGSIAPAPIAFSETGVKARIKNILNYKRPAFWVVIVCVFAVFGLSACLMTKAPKEPVESKYDGIFAMMSEGADIRVNNIVCNVQDKGYAFEFDIDTGFDGEYELSNPSNGDIYAASDKNEIKAGNNAVEVFVSNDKIEALIASEGQQPDSASLALKISEANSDKSAWVFVNVLNELSAGSTVVYQYDGIDYSDPYSVKNKPDGPLKSYMDVRRLHNFPGDLTDEKGITRDMLISLSFNEHTLFPDKQEMPNDLTPEQLMDMGKNPGLGIRSIHEAGITGKGVRVAIIDQPMYQDHPEFAGKIESYLDLSPDSKSSMHGPAVASLLVGENNGTAPGAKLYYAAAMSWTGDATTYAQSLDWIIEENEKLPEGDKIRVVSVSAAPSGPGSPFTKNTNLWDESVKRARDAGIIVLDCTEDNGIIGPGYYDLDDPENVEKMRSGFPSRDEAFVSDHIIAPGSRRTVAEEYNEGLCSYTYNGEGGLSWAIPYAAGVLTLGFELHPEYTGQQMLDVLYESAYIKDNVKFINPVKFIEMLK